MTSPALRHKIEKTRQAAHLELPKARLCADVIHAFVQDPNGQELKEAIQAMKAGIANNWSVTHAMQFMSGRRGEFAAEAAPLDEKPYLYFTHLIAKEVCHAGHLGAVEGINAADLERLRDLAKQSTAGT